MVKRAQLENKLPRKMSGATDAAERVGEARVQVICCQLKDRRRRPYEAAAAKELE
jgi:hypothetical protein